jgi:Flp pilus assembly protein TadD
MIPTLVVLGIAAYWPAMGNGFTNFDDNLYVTANERVKGGLTAENVSWAWKPQLGFWHPLTLMSLQLDATLFGLEPAAFHRTNLALHLASAIVLFLALRRMTGEDWPSFAVAALFTVHPINVEAVAWVAERKGLVSSLFWMLALYAYAWYTERPSLLRYLSVAAALVLGLLAKPTLVTLPFVLLLLDFWPLRRHTGRPGAAPPVAPRSVRNLIYEKLPLVGIALLFAVVAVEAESQFGSIASLGQRPLWVRAGNAVVAYARYLVHLAYPVGLVPFYPHPGRSLAGWHVLASLAVLLVTSVVAYRARHSAPYFAVGWIWFLITLAPMIGLIQIGGHAMADRYAYVPSIGIYLAVAWGTAELARQRSAERAVVSAMATVVTGLAVLTFSLVPIWRDDESLWTHTLRHSPDNWRANFFLGAVRAEQGRTEEAVEHFRAGLRVFPSDPHANRMLADLLVVQGRDGDAVQHFEVALASDPGDDNTRWKVAQLYSTSRNWKKAAEHLQVLARHHPEREDVQLQCGTALARSGQVEDGLGHLRAALALAPNSGVAHINMGVTLCQLGRFEEAKGHFEAALADTKQVAAARVNLGLIAEQSGNLPAAAEHYRAALQADGHDPAAKQRLDAVTRKLGN